jgi:uncharacterized iron-regulated membrane protein
LLDLHDNLLGGPTGRIVNGAAGVVVIVIGLTGIVVWWPGTQCWRRSLTLHRGVSWTRLIWDVHSAVGIWTVGFILLFAITGVYLGYPEQFAAVADRLQPPTEGNVGLRTVDRVTYWLAYLHFGRFGGWATKLLWALLGLAPACMSVTGIVMWWNRMVRARKRAL